MHQNESAITPSIQTLLANSTVATTLSLFCPSIGIRLRRVSRSLTDFFPDEKLAEILPSVFEQLGLFYSNPFTHCINGDVESTWLMLVHGVDPHIVGQNGETLLQVAVQSGSIALVHMLLERGCSIASKCAYGYTALHQVAYTPFSSLCSFLLDCGGNLDSLSRNGSTPLLIAAREGHVEVVETMLRYGADPNDGGDKGLTPLVLAASEGHLEVVELLLSFGADANLSLFEGRTALHEAVESAHIQVCASLIRLGNACINTKDESGESAVTLASRLGFDDIVELLLNTQYQGTESRAADKHAVSVTTSRLRLPPSVAISN